MVAIIEEHESLDALRTRLEDWKRRLIESLRDSRSDRAGLEIDGRADEIDAATTGQWRSLALELRDREQSLLGRIESALERIAEGRFATCTRCGQEISRKRLEAQLLTTVCVDCKEEEELDHTRSVGRSRRIA